MDTGLWSRREGLIARLLAITLLAAQFGAVAHAYSHLSDDAKGGPVTTQICGVCLSFAPLASAVGGPASTAALDPCGSDAAAPAVPPAIALDPHHPAFRSRAPPAIL